MDDVYVHLVPLPVKEAVTQNPDGSFSIFIREDLCREEQQRMYLHALQHIERYDFEQREEKNVQVLENDARKKEG